MPEAFVSSLRRQNRAHPEAPSYFDGCPLAMYVLGRDPEGGEFRLVEANSRFLAMAGYSREACGEPRFWSETIHPEDRAGAMANLWALERNGEIEQRFRFRHGDGHYFWTRNRVAARQRGAGASYLIGVWLDIEDAPAGRTRAELGQRGEALYRGAMEGSRDAFVVLDEQGRILEWSARAELMFGLRSEETLGRGLGETILARSAADQQMDDLSRLMYAAEGHSGGRHRRFTAGHRNGGEIPVEIQIFAVGLGGVNRSIVFIRDIAERLRTEARVLQAQKMEAIGQLTGGLAHDFNNILGVVIGSLELLEQPLTAAERKQVAKAALLAAERGVEVTRSLLSVARRQPLKPREVNVNDLLRELEPLIRQTAGKAIKVEVAPLALDSVAYIDQGGFNNAILNLVINARDAMPRGGSLYVYTHWLGLLDHAEIAPDVPSGEYIAIGVDDTGAGMSAAVVARAFDPFFSTKERGKGTGLGLAMVYGFARQSGGTAQIHSTPGKGTLVTLLLPVAGQARASLPLVEVLNESNH